MFSGISHCGVYEVEFDGQVEFLKGYFTISALTYPDSPLLSQALSYNVSTEPQAMKYLEQNLVLRDSLAKSLIEKQYLRDDRNPFSSMILQFGIFSKTGRIKALSSTGFVRIDPAKQQNPANDEFITFSCRQRYDNTLFQELYNHKMQWKCAGIITDSLRKLLQGLLFHIFLCHKKGLILWNLHPKRIMRDDAGEWIIDHLADAFIFPKFYDKAAKSGKPELAQGEFNVAMYVGIPKKKR